MICLQYPVVGVQHDIKLSSDDIAEHTTEKCKLDGVKDKNTITRLYQALFREKLHEVY